MAETSGKSLRVVVVTPEKAVLDEPADMVVLPLFDGELGVLPGHAPFVGQLAPGELRIKSAGAVKRFYIDAGFAQVAQVGANTVVNVLTARAVPADKLTPEAATAARATADALPATTPVERENRTKAVARAQGMAKVAAKGTGA